MNIIIHMSKYSTSSIGVMLVGSLLAPLLTGCAAAPYSAAASAGAVVGSKIADETRGSLVAPHVPQNREAQVNFNNALQPGCPLGYHQVQASDETPLAPGNSNIAGAYGGLTIYNGNISPKEITNPTGAGLVINMEKGHMEPTDNTRIPGFKLKNTTPQRFTCERSFSP